MQYQKRNYIKTYDENGVLISKVPVGEATVVEQPVGDEHEVAESGDE